MSNLVIGWPIFSDPGALYTPTFSGGSWDADYPLTNLQDGRLHRVARSADAQSANTQFEVDLGAARPIFVLGVPVHNITTDGTMRVRSSATSGSYGSPLYDTGVVSVWATARTAEEVAGINVGWVHVCTAVASARYLLFEITDTFNDDSYIELGRLVVGGGWQPTINAVLGADLGLAVRSRLTSVDGGEIVAAAYPNRRTFVGAFRHLDEDEALLNAFEWKRRVDTTGQFYFIYDPDDTGHLHRRAFLATLANLSALQEAALARHGTGFALVEVL